MIKVEHTKEHRVGYSGDSKTGLSLNVSHHHILVTDAKLVLVEAVSFDDWMKNHPYKLTRSFTEDEWESDQYEHWKSSFKPILISETEKIDVGDWYYYPYKNQINQATGLNGKVYAHPDCKKILALPEHFSPQQLQMIVDGKLKDGDKVLVECIQGEWVARENKVDYDHLYQIKLNPHITIYPVEEKMVPISLVKKAYMDAFGNSLPSFSHAYETAEYLEKYWNTWFEQNVK